MLILTSGCSSPTEPTIPPTPPETLTVACPAEVLAQSTEGNPVAVTFAESVVKGGTTPVATTCAPGSGENFPVGTTTVTCTSRDSKTQVASCSFPVTVTKVPRLQAASILAFGDSITAGVFADCAAVTPFDHRSSFGLWPYRELLDVSRSYPTRLQRILAARYTSQTISVRNEGLPGERVEEALGNGRLSKALASRPTVLLLQEGANNVSTDDSAIFIAEYLRDLVKQGKAAGAQVYLGTLLPQRKAGGCGKTRDFADKVPEINAAIRTAAAREGAILVDLHAAFGGVAGPLIGPDGLHPNDAGYEQIAATFFDALRQRLEN